MPNKAMVMIEMPENCEVCPFNYDYIECTASEEFLKVEIEDFDRRNDKCPLRPADVIPVKWIKNYASHKASEDLIDCYWHFWEEDVLKMIEDWERENEHKESD